jgi:hypothetical protein
MITNGALFLISPIQYELARMMLTLPRYVAFMYDLVTEERRQLPQPSHLPNRIVKRRLFRREPTYRLIKSIACQENKCQHELYLADFSHAGDYEYQNRGMLIRSAEMCVVLHRGELDLWRKDLLGQSLAMGMPTYFIENKDGKPKRIYRT